MNRQAQKYRVTISYSKDPLAWYQINRYFSVLIEHYFAYIIVIVFADNKNSLREKVVKSAAMK